MDAFEHNTAALNEFHESRQQLYQWLVRQTIELPDVDEIEPEVDDRINVAAYSFRVGVIALQQEISEPEVFTDRLAASWFKDEAERTSIFNSVSPYNLFEGMKVDLLRDVVRGAMASESRDEAVRSLHFQYRDSLAVDVQCLMAGVRLSKELLAQYGTQVPAVSQIEGMKQFVVQSNFLHFLADRQSKILLHKMFGQND